MESIEERFSCARVSKQGLELFSERAIDCIRGKPFVALIGRELANRVPQRFESLPFGSPDAVLACHPRSLWISRWSHAWAMDQSRFTVAGEIPSATAVSSIDMPPKNRHSTIRLCRSEY